MPSNYTANYKLNQWVKTDKVLMDDFNEDNKKIDEALAAKAEQKDLTALQTVVSQKAERSDVTSLQTAMSGKGNCRIDIQTYTGDGTFGGNKPKKLTFPAKPAVVFVSGRDSNGTALTLFQGQTVAYSRSYQSTQIYVTWSGNTVSWYAGSDATGQLNQTGVTYDVVALIAL